MTLWYCASKRACTRASLIEVLRLKKGFNFAPLIVVLRLKNYLFLAMNVYCKPLAHITHFAMKDLCGQCLDKFAGAAARESGYRFPHIEI